MKFGFVLPYGDARTAAESAYQAELAGWDGFFVWEPVWGIDAWVSLTAAAMRTSQIRLGTMLTPLSRMRPWKLASETATLDNLSNGRVILSVGLGALDTGFKEFGEETNRKNRAELLDEGLDILTGLWKGQPLNYHGKHYRIEESKFYPPPAPVQQPRIPIWVVGAWPFQKSMQRAMRYDGLLPAALDPQTHTFQEMTPALLRQIADFCIKHRSQPEPFDIISEGQTPGDNPSQAADLVTPWRQAGATWWNETMWDVDDLALVIKRIQQGPPRVV
jgi:alkanesulfonate monooxygenase SsuD/methylene tetrahydromethanopterin reductase-like flavin-dependent oxidoreductase (luciferase family)